MSFLSNLLAFKNHAWNQFVILSPWKVPWNWIAFYQNSFVYHLIRPDSGWLANEVFTSNPIVSSKQWLNGLKITNWNAVRKVSEFGVVLVGIFPHSDWIRIQSECEKMRTRITPNTDTLRRARYSLWKWGVKFSLRNHKCIFFILSKCSETMKFISCRLYINITD